MVRIKLKRNKEEDKLLEATAEHLKPILVMALNTGMRRGEILGLKWNQIDFKKRLIHVTKTKSGRNRLVPINDVLRDELQNLKRKNGSREFVFPFKNVRTAFENACRRASIEGLRFHDLRHTFATRLVENGVDLITVKELLGHHSVVVTQRYTHSNSEQKRKAVEILPQICPHNVHTESIKETRRGVSPSFLVN